MEIYDNRDWLWQFIYRNWEKIYIPNKYIDKIQKWCIYKNWKIIETEEYKQNLLKEEKNKIEKEFQETIKQITAWYSQAEQKGWGLQLTEAKKVLTWNTSIFLQKICDENWEDINEFAKKIVDKAEQYSIAYAAALWIKQAKLKKLEK